MSSKKKILYIVTKSNFGGAQRYVYDLAVNLPKKEFETVVAFGGEGRLKEMLEKAGIRTVVIKKLARDINLADELSVFFDLLSLLKKEVPDVIHLNSSKIGGLGSLAGRIVGYPKIIFTAHGWAFNEERSFSSRLLIRFLSWLTVLMSHKIIAVSGKIMSETPRFLVKLNKVLVIHNGAGQKELLTRDEARLKLMGKVRVEKKIIIGTIAELHKNKGLSYALEAVSLLKKSVKNLVYVIIGDGEEKNSLEKMIKNMGLERSVKLVGFKDEAPKYLSAFDIFLLPSITEAFGLSILEAGNAGLPVVATSIGGIPEIIKDMKTGILIRPKSPREISRALKFLVENPSKAKEFGENLRQEVGRDFPFQKMIDKTISLYKE